MPALSAVFLDTCIFDAEKMNFESTRLKTFVETAKSKEVRLLQPHPTAQEVGHHIDEMISETVETLRGLRKKTPLIREFKEVPQTDKQLERVRSELVKKLLSDWTVFRKELQTVALDYSSVDLREIMTWYGNQSPPFDAGKKRKEFPDAFAFAAIRNYAVEHKINVAVVSHDKDLRKACAHVPSLHYFPTLDAFSHAILKEEEQFSTASSLASRFVSELTKQIKIDFLDLGFVHEIDWNSDVSDVEVMSVEIDPESIDVVGLAHEVYTISFQAEVNYSALVHHVAPDSWVSMGDGDVVYLHDCEGTVEDSTEVNCIARITTNSDWSDNDSIVSLQFDEHLITVTTPAPEVDNRDPDDQ